MTKIWADEIFDGAISPKEESFFVLVAMQLGSIKFNQGYPAEEFEALAIAADLLKTDSYRYEARKLFTRYRLWYSISQTR